jgi:hypothetical protein
MSVELNRPPMRGLLLACALTAALHGLPAAHADVGGTFSLYDADRNGYLDRTEYDASLAAKRDRADVATFWAFERVDTDGDGRISEQELIEALLADLRRKRP